MTFKGAKIIDEYFTLDEYCIPIVKSSKIQVVDELCKGYIYANLFFFDEVNKELEKLRNVIQKIHDEVMLELGMETPSDDPTKLFIEISMRARIAVGDDSLDAMIKDMLGKNFKHMVLMMEEDERKKFEQIDESILTELMTTFYKNTLGSAKDLALDVKTFKFSSSYIGKLTTRQKRIIAPALRLVAFEHNIRIDKLEIDKDWNVKYVPEKITSSFAKEEVSIKEQIKALISRTLPV